MKAEIEIQDDLLMRAEEHARRTGQSLRSVVEAGLRHVLGDTTPAAPYILPDMSVGDADAPDPLEAYSWARLRDTIYARPEPPE